MTSVICAVRGCHNNWKKSKLSLSLPCLEHGMLRSECCGPAFHLHAPPSGERDFQCWLKALNLKKPPKRPYVCSFHFVEKKPTALHPYPEKWLGYDTQLKRSRKALRKQSDVLNSAVEATATQHEEPGTVPPLDHDYTVDLSLHSCLLLTDDLSLLYTGLPLDTFNFLADQLTKGHINTFQLDARDQILMTLMKLRLNLLQSDLAERFRVSQPGVGNVMSVWLDIMEEKMRCFIPWLDRETINATLPQCFKELYPSTTCVIDCSEIQLHKTHTIDSAAESYSLYNGQNIIKYMVAIAPCGLIMFVSATYGSRCCDKFITSDSGFLEYLHPGDIVMADQGFDISDLLHERQVELLIPAFSKNGLQLSGEDTTHTRGTADVQVHVEKIIRRIKKFRILTQTIPFNLAHKCDKILKVCAALCNLQGDIDEDEND